MKIYTRVAILIAKYCSLDREYHRDVISLFEPGPRAKLLDLGCDDGEYTLKVAEKIGTSHVFGIDVVKESVEKANARGIDCYQADLDGKIPFEDDSFDAVCANQIIEHLSNTDDFIKEIHRVLKPSGYAVISTPNLAAWHMIAFLLLAWQPHSADVSDYYFWAGRPHTPREESMGGKMPHHRRLFVLRALKDLLQHHGFTVEKSIGTGLRPLPTYLARMLVRFMTGRADIITVKVRKDNAREVP